MPKLKSEAPPVDQIEQDFLDAISRLREGKPRHKLLKGRSQRGKLKVNPSTVALEAGHSRTLIGKITCRYPRVRLKIEADQVSSNAVPVTHTELIGSLRSAKLTLAAQVNLYKSEALEHFTARKKAEKAAAIEQATNARLIKELAELGKVPTLVPRKKNQSRNDKGSS